MSWNKSTTIGKSDGETRKEQSENGETRATAFKSRTSNFRHPRREGRQTVDALNEVESERVYVPR